MIKDVEKKQFYYHCSACDLRKIEKNGSITLNPRIPMTAPSHEPQIERICVSPLISGCICAILGDICEKIFVYQTKEKTNAKYPYSVYDSEWTEERWILQPTNFKFVQILSKKEIFKNNKDEFEKLEGFFYNEPILKLMSLKQKKEIVKKIEDKIQSIINAKFGMKI